MRHIETKMNHYGDLLESGNLTVNGVGSFRYCSLGIVPEGKSARKVFQGPLVEGPWGFATTHALVIDNYGGSAAQNADNPVFETGEWFTVEGLPGVWTFRAPNPRKLEGDGPVLAEISLSKQYEAACAEAARLYAENADTTAIDAECDRLQTAIQEEN